MISSQLLPAPRNPYLRLMLLVLRYFAHVAPQIIAAGLLISLATLSFLVVAANTNFTGGASLIVVAFLGYAIYRVITLTGSDTNPMRIMFTAIVIGNSTIYGLIFGVFRPPFEFVFNMFVVAILFPIGLGVGANLLLDVAQRKLEMWLVKRRLSSMRARGFDFDARFALTEGIDDYALYDKRTQKIVGTRYSRVEAYSKAERLFLKEAYPEDYARQVRQNGLMGLVLLTLIIVGSAFVWVRLLS